MSDFEISALFTIDTGWETCATNANATLSPLAIVGMILLSKFPSPDNVKSPELMNSKPVGI